MAVPFRLFRNLMECYFWGLKCNDVIDLLQDLI